MSDEPHLFRRLSDQWRAAATGPEACAAAARWAADAPVLAGRATPAEVVAACHRRDDPARSAALLRAVLAQVGDGPWPARTVLQAVLPGLCGLVRRARHQVGPDRPWPRFEELDQAVLALAAERIATLAPDPPPWPARAIIDGTWQRLRGAARAERRWTTHRCLLDSLPERPAEQAANAAEDLVEVLAAAVDTGVLEPADGWLIYASRIDAAPLAALAARTGHSERWTSRRRRAAENLLIGAGPELLGAGR